jgi:anti-sigma factor RsiW
MHGSIRHRLEGLLAGNVPAEDLPDLHNHLSACSACSSEFRAMEEQRALFRPLRADDECEPAAGFYARVLQRIEEHTKDSIWAIFVYSPFGKRLALASFTIAMLLGSYVVTQETRDGHWHRPSAVSHVGSLNDFTADALVAGSQSQQREAVLENLILVEGKVQ